jgi:hypothetical protein
VANANAAIENTDPPALAPVTEVKKNLHFPKSVISFIIINRKSIIMLFYASILIWNFSKMPL